MHIAWQLDLSSYYPILVALIGLTVLNHLARAVRCLARFSWLSSTPCYRWC